MIDYQACCREHARLDARFRHCPRCGTTLFRCPECRCLITPLGSCDACLRPVLEAPTGLVLAQGSGIDLPLRIVNAGPASFRALAVSCHTGPNEVRLDLGERPVDPGLALQCAVRVEFPRAGDFGLEVRFELSWTHAARLGFAAFLPGTIEITSRHEGPLISAIGQGTGSLVNVSGAADQAIARALRTRGLSEASIERRDMEPFPGAELDGFGDGGRVVSWATALEVPDMLDWGAPLLLRPLPLRGIVLGRDRPCAEDEAGTDAALRFAPKIPEAREISGTISRRHWRLYPWDGLWWIEQLGREPSVALTPDRTRRRLGTGDRCPLPGGSRLYALAGSRHRLGVELSHASVEGSHVVRSALRTC